MGLRSKGYSRPLSVLQIRTNARNKCRLNERTGMLTPTGILNISVHSLTLFLILSALRWYNSSSMSESCCPSFGAEKSHGVGGRRSQ